MFVVSRPRRAGKGTRTTKTADSQALLGRFLCHFEPFLVNSAERLAAVRRLRPFRSPVPLRSPGSPEPPPERVSESGLGRVAVAQGQSPGHCGIGAHTRVHYRQSTADLSPQA